MFWQRVRFVLLAGAFTVVAALTARAEDAAPPAAAAAPVPAAAPCAPQYRTVCVSEWVPETYPCTRTTYKTECRQETYTAYRNECVPETRTVVRTVYRQVPEVRKVTKCVNVCVPCVEQRTIWKTHVTCKPVTTITRKCVDKGHYECREVPCRPSCLDRLRHRFRHRRDCCDPCCEPCCPPRTKTVRVWVPCPTWIEVPCTRIEKVCESRPVTINVTTYKTEVRHETCQVTCYKCVPEHKSETVTVMTAKCVPYQATRTVSVCVPSQETVMMTRMVCRTVQKQVPVETCCAPSCGDCAPSCCDTCSYKRGRCR